MRSTDCMASGSCPCDALLAGAASAGALGGSPMLHGAECSLDARRLCLTRRCTPNSPRFDLFHGFPRCPCTSPAAEEYGEIPAVAQVMLSTDIGQLAFWPVAGRVPSSLYDFSSVISLEVSTSTIASM